MGLFIQGMVTHNLPVPPAVMFLNQPASSLIRVIVGC